MIEQRSGPSPLRWYRWGLLAVSIVGLLMLLGWAGPVLLPFVFAFVIAYLLAPSVQMFDRHGLNRVVSILLVYAIAGLIIAGTIVYMFPLLLQESVHLIRLVPNFIAGLQHTWAYWLNRFHEAPIPRSIRKAINQTGTHLEGQMLTWLKGLVTAVFGLVPGVLSLIVAPVLAFYLLKDLDRIRSRFWHMIPIAWRPQIYKLGVDMDSALNGFIRGQLMVALVVGSLSGLWVWVLHIPLAVLIGAIAGITDVIPYVGPIAGALPAVLLGFNISPYTALYAVLGFVVIHQLEGVVIAPKLVGDSVGIHPLIIIFAILVGGELAGVVGLLLAVPLTAAGKVLFSHMYRWLILT